MSVPAKILSTFVLLLGVIGFAGPAEAQIENLMMKVPQFANAIVVIDADAVSKTPLAIKEQWTSKLEAAAASRPIILPPEASRIVIASHMGTQDQMQTDWEMAVMDLHEPIPLRSIAKAEGGYVDRINGLESAWTPSNAYFVSFGQNVLGMMYPANRQYVSRWADFAKNSLGVVASDYLKQASYKLGPTGQIVMAIDLKDAVQPHRLNGALDNSPTIAKAKLDIPSVVPVLLSLQGVTLSVNVTDKAEGSLRVDFGQNVAPLKTVAKPLFLEVLNKRGAMIEDFEKWNVTVGDTYIKLEGNLSTNGMRRVFSILEMPSTKFSTLSTQIEQMGTQGMPNDSMIAQSSLAYFKSVGTLIDDLQTDLRNNRDNQAMWMDRYAKKVDRLPILNVDDQLLTFGTNVAESFRNMGLAKRGANISAGVRKAGVYTEYYYSGTNYAFPGDTYQAYGSDRSQARVKNEIDRQEQSQALQVRFDGFKQIEDARSKLRIDMTKKYNMEF